MVTGRRAAVVGACCAVAAVAGAATPATAAPAKPAIVPVAAVKPSHKLRIEVVPPAKARSCSVRLVAGRHAQGPFRLPVHGASSRLTATVSASARGVWKARATCVLRGGARTSADTPIRVSAGRAGRTLVRPGTVHTASGLVRNRPSAPGRSVPGGVGGGGCSSRWMSDTHVVGTGIATKASLTPTTAARVLARVTPGAYAQMWADFTHCAGLPALTPDELDSMYKQMVCHGLYGIGYKDGPTWDFEAWHRSVPWPTVLNPRNECQNWGDVPTAASEFQGRIVQSADDTATPKASYLVDNLNGINVSRHVLTARAYGCLRDSGHADAGALPGAFVARYLATQGPTVDDSVCPSGTSDGGTPECSGAGGTAAGGPGNAGFHVKDDFYGGTWGRNDPCDGSWHQQSDRPTNAGFWYPNGTGVGVDCARAGAAYVVRFGDGHSETWTTWLHVTDGKWFPAAAAQEITTDTSAGLPAC